jgi:hypothetical protein
MKISAFLFVFLFFGCGGSLTDEQRKQMKENMELNKIVRVTDAEITEAAFEEGRETLRIIESFKGDSVRIDSLMKINQGRIRYIRPGISNALELEQQLVDAYLADESGSFRDNVQEVRNASGDFDSLLYSKPHVTKLPDGPDQLNGVWNIWLRKKELVLEIGKTK